MDRIKKALILAALAAILQLSGCSKNNNNNNNKENKASIIQEYNSTVEKDFEAGEHFVTVVYEGDSHWLDELEVYAQESFENLYVPDGYAIHDFEYITRKGTATGLCVVFVNNKKVTATGVLKEDGNYHYEEFGKIIKEKTLTK